MIRSAPLVLVSAFALVLGACEYPGVPHPQASAVQAERAVPGGPAPRSAAPSPAQDAQVAQVLQGKAQVVQRDFKLDPDALAVKAGEVTFVLKNEGRYTHDFRVEGNGVDKKGPKVGSGRTVEWRIALQPGTYRISCPVSNHADRGMVGTLTVVP